MTPLGFSGDDPLPRRVADETSRLEAQPDRGDVEEDDGSASAAAR